MSRFEEVRINNGVYCTQKTNGQLVQRSNCTIRFIQPVVAGELSGYIGIVTQKNGSERYTLFVNIIYTFKDLGMYTYTRCHFGTFSF